MKNRMSWSELEEIKKEFKERACNLCDRYFQPSSKFSRFCIYCKRGDPVYREAGGDVKYSVGKG